MTEQDKAQPITVRELMTLLETQDPDLPVILEGCDCYGWATGGVQVDTHWLQGTSVEDSQQTPGLVIKRFD